MKTTIDRKLLKSQKARGIHDLINSRADALTASFVPGGAKDIHIINAIAAFNNKFPVLFVRPCPESPNHGGDVAGFQSEPVAKDGLFEHLMKVKRAITKKGLNADIVIMPMIHAEVSAVAAPGKYIIWGTSNNGVTAGIGKTITLPLNENESFHWLTSNGHDPSKVEIEFVKWVKQLYCVQIRAASQHLAIAPPPLGAMAGFVPIGKMTVKSVYQVKDLNDVGELEVLKTGETEGLVVVQKDGSMLSHAAAHCRGAGISFVIGESPSIGDMLVESAIGWVVKGDENTEVKGYDPKDYIQYFLKGFDKKTNWEYRKLGTFFHQWATSPLGDPKDTAFLAGLFVRWLIQAGLTACCGESRHLDSVYLHEYPAGRQKIESCMGKAFGKEKPARNTILTSLKESNVTSEDLLKVAQWSSALFSKSWSSGMGGPKWKRCSVQAAKSIVAIQKMKVPDIIKHVNLLENASHNNGRLYDKYENVIEWLDISTSTFRLAESYVIRSAEVATVALMALHSDLEDAESSSGNWGIMAEITPELFTKKVVDVEQEPDEESNEETDEGNKKPKVTMRSKKDD